LKAATVLREFKDKYSLVAKTIMLFDKNLGMADKESEG